MHLPDVGVEQALLLCRLWVRVCNACSMEWSGNRDSNPAQELGRLQSSLTHPLNSGRKNQCASCVSGWGERFGAIPALAPPAPFRVEKSASFGHPSSGGRHDLDLPGQHREEKPISALLFTVIATIIFAAFALFYATLGSGGNIAVWLIAGLAYGAALAFGLSRPKE